MAFVEPLINCGANFFQLTGEEVIGAVNQDKFFWRWQRFKERFDVGARTELIAAALDDQFWFRAGAQISQVRAIRRNPQANQLRNALVRAARKQSHH